MVEFSSVSLHGSLNHGTPRKSRLCCLNYRPVSKSAQGQWSVNIDNNNKISGSAILQSDKGAILTYTLDGLKNESVYTVNMSQRTDGKTGCVWSGHIPAGADMKSHGLIGEVHCDGKVGFTVKAGF
jgi:hypothetical protein